MQLSGLGVWGTLTGGKVQVTGKMARSKLPDEVTNQHRTDTQDGSDKEQSVQMRQGLFWYGVGFGGCEITSAT